MRYAMVTVVNGNFSVAGEYGTNKESAFVGFHNQCKNYWNAPDVISATVAVVDENLDIVEGKIEYIAHAPQE